MSKLTWLGIIGQFIRMKKMTSQSGVVAMFHLIAICFFFVLIRYSHMLRPRDFSLNKKIEYGDRL